MKRILIACSVMTCLFCFGVAFAQDDVAGTYQSHCQSCHGADAGRAPAPGVDSIKGRDSSELLKELQGYKAGTFGGAQKQVMQGVAKQLSDDQMKSLADYVSKL